MTFIPDTKFPAGTSLGQRMGLVTYWAASGVALLALGAGVVAALDSDATSEATMFLGIGLGVALVMWLIGRAILFVFADR